MSLSTSTLEYLGNYTPDGCVIDAYKLGFYKGTTPVVQATAPSLVISAADTTTNLAAAVYAIQIALSGTNGGCGIMA